MDYKTGYDNLPPTPTEQLLRLPCSGRVKAIMEELETMQARRICLMAELEWFIKKWLLKEPPAVIEHKVRKVRVIKEKVVKQPRKSRLTLIPLEG